MFFSEEAYKNILKKAMMCCSIHNCYVFWFSNIWHQKTLNSLFRIVSSIKKCNFWIKL